jgi:ABC-type lipoprotein release transport system permease subunit
MNVIRLAWRSLWRHRRRTVITLVSVAFGVALVVFAVSLNEGAYAGLVDDAVRMQSGHLTIEHPEYREAPAIDLVVDDVNALRARIEAIDGVDATKLIVLGQGIARSGSGSVGVGVMGIEPSREALESPLARNIVTGDYLDDTDEARVVVGTALAKRLALDVGKKLVLASNDVDGDLVEALYRVKGTFHTGADEVDGFVVQVPLTAARELYGLGSGQATQIGVLLDDADGEADVLPRLTVIAASVGAVVRRWQEVMPELNAFIRLDRVSDWTFEGMLIVLVLFTIFNTLLMSVIERERELCVLIAIGTPALLLRLQVLVEACFIAALGCVSGVLIGAGIAYYFEIYGLDMSGFFDEGVTVSGLAMSSRIHAKLRPEFIAVIGLTVFAAVLVLGAIVMRRVARFRLADVLR